jgi:hypothetical protein
MWQLLVAILVIMTGAQIVLRPAFVRRLSVALWTVVVLLVGRSLYLTVAQYQVWMHAGGLSRYLLPPYRGIEYFIGYSVFHHWGLYLISGIFAVLFYYGARWYNRRHQGRFFDPEEPLIGALALLVVGWPGVVVYIIAFIVIFVLSSVIATLVRGKGFRLSPYYLWLPVAIFVILMNTWILHQTWWWSFLKL